MVGDVTERSVMAVGLLPPPLLGVSSLDWAPLAAAGGAFFHVRVVSDRDSSCPGLTRASIETKGFVQKDGLPGQARQ